jgi:hypothetical protein
LNRFWFGFDFFKEKFDFDIFFEKKSAWLLFFDKNRTELKMITPTSDYQAKFLILTRGLVK